MKLCDTDSTEVAEEEHLALLEEVQVKTRLRQDLVARPSPKEELVPRPTSMDEGVIVVVKGELDKLELKVEVGEEMVEVREDLGEYMVDPLDGENPEDGGDHGDGGGGDQEEAGDEGGSEEQGTPKAAVKWSFKKWCWEEVEVEAEVRVRRRGRPAKGCGRCQACLAQDCGLCRCCLDRPSRGGRGTMKQKCERRKCRF